MNNKRLLQKNNKAEINTKTEKDFKVQDCSFNL